MKSVGSARAAWRCWRILRWPQYIAMERFAERYLRRHAQRREL